MRWELSRKAFILAASQPATYQDIQ